MILLASGGLAVVSGRFLTQRHAMTWVVYFIVSLSFAACSLWREPLTISTTTEAFDIYRVWTNDSLAVAMQWLVLLFGLLTCAALFEAPIRRQDPMQTHGFLLFAVAGLMLVARANDFLSLGMSFEVVSLAAVAFRKCTDLGLKSEIDTENVNEHRESPWMSSLWLNMMLSGWMWFGIALLSNAVATTQFDTIRLVLSEAYHVREMHVLTGGPSKLILLATGLIVISLLGRMGLVPFHLTLGDTSRRRATLPWVFGILAGQFAGSMALGRLCGRVLVGLGHPTIVLMTVVSVTSFLMSSVLAVRGLSPGLKFIPRWLTSLVLLQSGWLVCGIMIAAAELEHPEVRWGAFPQQNESLSFFVFSQLAGIIALWGIVGVLDYLCRIDRGIEFLEDVKGLRHVAPVASVALLISLASSIGSPWTAGFWGRWFTMLAGSNVHIKSTSTVFEPHGGVRMVILAGTVATIFAACAVIRIAREMFLESTLSRPQAMGGRGPLTVGLIAAMVCLLLGVALRSY